MNKVFRRIAIFLLYRLGWRKLLLIGAITTTIGLILQTTVLPAFPINHRWNFHHDRLETFKNISTTNNTTTTTAGQRRPITKLINNNNTTTTINNNNNNDDVVKRVPSPRRRPSIPSPLSLSPPPPARRRQIISISPPNRRSVAKVVPTHPRLARISDKRARAEERRTRRRQKTDDEDEDVRRIRIAPPPPPPRRASPTPLQRRIWSLPPNAQLMYAKRELQNAPIITNDTDLYPPLFKNISVFKRSYQLMELILKVYVYPDGKKPIFHQPWLTGIYASEGWFMKLIEENRQFSTRDPKKAHLFYLPYSARRLQLAVYKVGSHNLRPLSTFLKDYVNLLSSKYPYWNRTHGADHFLVACHDWGPYTLTEHEELTMNTIKALCNADTSEGIFKPDKDVSLPETSIRMPSRPHRNVGGGVRVSQRPILAFFAGSNHGRVRPLLLKHWQQKDDDMMRVYEWLPKQVSRKMSYIQHMRSSKFCLCPMGFEVNSPRIVEAIYYECIPVIIADNFALPLGEVLDWSSFSMTVAEKDIARLKEILLAVPLNRYLKMLSNLKMLQRHFFWNLRPQRYDLFHMILHSIWFNRLKQIQDVDVNQDYQSADI